MESRLANPANESQSLATEKLVTDFKEMLQRAEQKTIERAKAADQLVRSHPYQTIGFAVGLGVLVGLLAGRRWHA